MILSIRDGKSFHPLNNLEGRTVLIIQQAEPREGSLGSLIEQRSLLLSALKQRPIGS